jgi:plasmid replication initiation protein
MFIRQGSNMAIAKNKENHQSEIKKHINAIHCSNNISLVQRKLFNALLFNAYQDLPKKSQYVISVKQLSELIGYDSNDRKKLKSALMGLITTAIEWNLLDHTNSDYAQWQASSIIASAKIENGVCTYEFSSLLRELLYRPDVYGRINLDIMAKFKSGYGLALYENCIRFQGLPNTGWLSLRVFRKLMGIADDTYPVFCDFRKRVIDIALREVNQHSDLHVIPEFKRVNKKVTNIRFKLSLKCETMIHVEHSQALLSTQLTVILMQFGLSAESCNDVLARYEPGYVKEKIELIKNSASFQSGKVRDLAAYLVDALKRDYKKSRINKVAMTEIENHKAKLATEAVDKQKQQHRDYLYSRIDDYLSTLQDEQKTKLLHQFEQSCDDFIVKKYKKYGLKHAGVRALFNIYIKNNKLIDFDLADNK